MPLNTKLSSPENLLLAMAFIMPLVFSVWMAMLNNFVIEQASFTGVEIGILQSLREVPGFLAFTTIYVLFFIKEQRLALLSLGLTSLGVAATGYFPSVIGLYLTTVIMSVGFHYFETVNQSLTLQWISKDKTAHFLGRALSVKSIASLLAFGGIWLLMKHFSWSYQATYMLFGSIALIFTIALAISFPYFAPPVEQSRRLILRKRYLLFYALTFFSGARRQIFVVFAGFLMVEKFNYSVADVSALFMINYVFNWLFAAKIGQFIGRVSERNVLRFEYIGLTILFILYGLVENANIAAVLYVIDHLFFALAIAIKTYFQKIALPEDIAASAGVSFSINHIAAVVIPALLGMVWIVNASWVFYIGAGFACCSLLLTLFMPYSPSLNVEFRRKEKALVEQVL
ncbi:MFS transporter [Cognaticolwellia beringensis]|uniref:MFS transporter n=1 Tax=Cognaticolwellia beringensis TaxID=1967665 RepID=A0A222G8G3_9GAMM|nr:MFS transporter [Cognaticolwellia beringensis]ASP48186.1 MFS transporter [Cognaticolwellia beringensis]